MTSFPPFRVLILCALGLSLWGCRGTPAPEPQPQQTASTTGGGALQPPLSTQANIQLLRSTTAQLSTTVAAIPGPTERTDRELIGQAFGQIADAVEVLHDPRVGDGMPVRIRTIRRAGQRVGQAPADAAIAPAVEQGLMSATAALQWLQQRLFPDQQNLADDLGRLEETVRSLDQLEGSLHRLVAAQALSSTSQILNQMTDLLAARAEQGSTTPPAQPAPAP